MQFLVRAYDGAGKLDYLANEPYVLEKVWEKVEVETINVVIANACSIEDHKSGRKGC